MMIPAKTSSKLALTVLIAALVGVLSYKAGVYTTSYKTDEVMTFIEQAAYTKGLIDARAKFMHICDTVHVIGSPDNEFGIYYSCTPITTL